MIKLGGVTLTPEEAARFTLKQRENLRSWGIVVPDVPEPPPTPRPAVPLYSTPTTAGSLNGATAIHATAYHPFSQTHVDRRLQQEHQYQEVARQYQEKANELSALLKARWLESKRRKTK